MAQKFDIGAGGAVFVGPRDLTRSVKSFSSTQNFQPQDATGLQSPGRALEFLQGLSGHAISLRGMLPVSHAIAAPLWEKATGQNREPEPVLLAPWGSVAGYYAEFIDTQQSQAGSEGMTPNITTLNADFVGDGDVHRGTLLHSSQGAVENNRISIFLIKFTAASTALRLAFKLNSTTSAEWSPGANAATLTTRLEELYGAGNVVATSLNYATSGGVSNGALRVTFTGALAGKVVTMFSVISGEVQRYQATDNGTFGGVAIVPGDAVGDIEDDLQAAGGDLANVTADGSSNPVWPGGDVLTGATRTNEFNFVDPGWSEWDRGAGAAPVTIDSYTAGYIVEGAWAEHRLYTRQNTGDAWQLLDTFTPGTWNEEHTLLRYVRLEHEGYSSGLGNGAQSQAVSFETTSDPVAGLVDILVRFPVSLGNVTPKAATGTDAVVSTPTPGGTAPEEVGVLDIGNLSMITGVINGTAIDNGAATNDGGKLIITVPYASDNCNTTLRLQHADDSGGVPGAFTTVGTVTKVITEAGAWILDIPRGTEIKRWTRLAATAGQVTGELAASAALMRNPSTI